MRAERPARVGITALLILVGVAVTIYGVDQVSKQFVVTSLAEGEVVPVLGNVLQWQFVRNPGAAFSIASGMTWIFTILAAGVITFIVWFARRIRSIAWALVFGLLLGGVLGNLTDRLFREPGFGVGHVIDFISTPWLIPAIYNVADIAIVSSMVLFMILTIRGVGLDGSRPARDRTGAEAEEPGRGERDARGGTAGVELAREP
ncbi:MULTISPECIES: signal peptidase II [Agromyces]|uniref:Lipoprotein signal peptidase n=1 Tax=Agromyces indicus TaxID=758919 RepID=A0ABU1FNW3_9MICO|nr:MULTISPECIES: signal peptidase II [Agromyces]KZE95501.1 Lipoprotein signal peptidase [Agromyces sp. NDB4Y10]MCK8609516.1 signal peptidase II [Agromyces sp. C10]MDR5693451.1 signal peptidase II [Agromyces indicus]